MSHIEFDLETGLPVDNETNRQRIEQGWHMLREQFKETSFSNRVALHHTAMMMSQLSEATVFDNSLMTLVMITMSKIDFENMDAAKEIEILEKHIL